MIDKAQLEAMRGRYDAARGAVVAVRMHTADGIFGSLPADEAVAQLPAAVASVHDVPDLIAECDRLAPASYLSGPEQCCEGDCEDEDPPDGQWCSHITEKVATFDDVKRAEHLERLVGSLRDRLSVRSELFARELAEAIDDALEAMEAAESGGWAH